MTMTVAHWLVATAAGLILLAYHYDTRRKHALRHLLAAVGCGFAAMALIGQLDDALLGWPAITSVAIVKAAAIALTEEGGKLACLLLVAHTLFRKRLAGPLDGLLIGQMIGLGMALNESLLYLRIEPPGVQTLGMEVVRLFAHSLMAGVIGFGVGCTRSEGLSAGQRRHCLLLCVGLTTTIHFSWNAIAYGRQADLPAHLIPMILMLTLMLLWKTFCNIAQRQIGDAWPMAAVPVTTGPHRMA